MNNVGAAIPPPLRLHITLNDAPMHKPAFSNNDIIEIIALTRSNLYNRCRPCGAMAILQEMESLGVHPLPSISSVNRILARLGLTHKRTG
jgi:hypothetical protein